MYECAKNTDIKNPHPNHHASIGTLYGVSVHTEYLQKYITGCKNKAAVSVNYFTTSQIMCVIKLDSS